MWPGSSSWSRSAKRRGPNSLESIPDDELIESNGGGFVRLTYSRPWPRYVVEWSVRRRRGDTDFPVASGEVEAGPEEAESSDVWNRLRERALQAVEEAGSKPGAGSGGKGSWLARLFGRA